jgi:transcriptional regulator with XRE-family HTH domain
MPVVKQKHQRKEYPVFEQLKRKLQGYDMQSVADAAGVAVATLYHWQTGHVRAPQLRTLSAVAEVLGYEITLYHVDKPVRMRRNLSLV